MADVIITDNEHINWFDVVALAAGQDSLIYNGVDGDDVFNVYAGVSKTSIYGTNGAGDFADLQFDTIELFGSAHLNSIVGIDVLRFASPIPATTTLSYNANSSFGVSKIGLWES
ncbi:hypothetical protein ACETIH_00890 [Microvirga arabica]|uniref:Uncharacterized protein n=1 Tax=Microvirga arabica TaxID=1128671 RepID=A0ABV6Y227_9HYPH